MVPKEKFGIDYTNRVSAASKIFAKYGDFIRAVIRYHIVDETCVDDLFQDFYLSLVSKPLPMNVQNIKSYLYKAVTSDIIDSIRRTKNYRKQLNRFSERYRNFSPNNNPVSILIEDEETNKMFRQISKHLHPAEAKAITLKYKFNYNVREIAKRVGVKPRSVSTYISVGLKKLRRVLTVNGGGSHDS